MPLQSPAGVGLRSAFGVRYAGTRHSGGKIGMKRSGIACWVAAAAVALLPGTQPAAAEQRAPDELTRRTLERRAVEAAIWGVPLVAVDALRQAFQRDAGAGYGDILYLSRPADAKLQFTTPDTATPYVYFNFNTKDGPVVLDFPAAAGAGLLGSLNDAWQMPLADVGPAGEDMGHGGAYLILPPDYKGSLPARLYPIRSKTYNGYATFRVIPAGPGEAELAKAIELVKRIRVYPLARSRNPPQQRFIDIAGKPFDALARFDDTFFDALARMVQEEPVQTRDLVPMANLRSLGIEKGKEFAPDAATRKLLKKAAAEVHAGLMRAAATNTAYWPGSRWGFPSPLGPSTGFSFETGDRLDIDERAKTFFLASAPPKKLGTASAYLASYHDAKDRPLRGERSYRLQIPASVPAKQAWSVTAYDLTTAAFMRESPRPALDSRDEALVKLPDGTIELYFGPKAPAGKAANFIYTAPGKPWFAIFRFYGAEKALFEKTWRLPDIAATGG
jgi:hypothetical protein